MLVDARAVEANERITADVCVIGSGPAGMTLAKELASPGRQIVVMESGGEHFDPQAQALCAGTSISPDRYASEFLSSSRCRQLGGTANLWNDEPDEGKGNELVRLLRLDPIDFEKREWLPYSGWPITRSDLDPFYEEALQIAGAGQVSDAPNRDPRLPDLFLSNARLRTMMSQFGARAVYTSKYPAELRADPHLRVYLNATVLELITQDNCVEYARVGIAPDRQFQIRARFFVVAAGGIENARLLLLSNRTRPNGLGNEHDLVGRFFMDHPSFRLGVFTPYDRNLFRSAGLYDHHLSDGACAMGKLTFREEVMRREEMLNICVTLTPRGRSYESPAVKILKRLTDAQSAIAAAQLVGKEFRTLARGWDEVLARCYDKITKRKLRYFDNKGGWSRLGKAERRFRRFELACLCEQAPNPENRVMLGDATDRFGQKKVKLSWRWSEVDLRSIRRAHQILQEEFRGQNLGTFIGQEELEGADRPRFSSPHHHIGTTRMHSNPKEGVVDADCRVHGVANLYLAGSSVFPTGGFANPTLTIVALALRLSYHLQALMKPPIFSVFPPPTAPPEREHD